MVLVKVGLSAALGFTVLILLARGMGGLIPTGELMPLALARIPSQSNITMADVDRGLTYTLVHEGWWDNDPELSPDGQEVLFTSYAARDGQGALNVVDVKSGRRQQITSSGGIYSLPAWSPDERQVAFAATYLGETEIYVLNLLDQSLRQLTGGFGTDTHPNWSPDGGYIVYVSGDGFDPADLYVMPTECPEENGLCGMAARQLTDQPGYDWSPAWSPDGKLIAFASDRGGGANVYVMDTDCVYAEPNTECVPRVRTMTRERFPYGITQIMWSRDGKRLRFVSLRGLTEVEIYELEAGCDLLPEGCAVRRLLVVG
jgi:Tol biopolymer transport system component